MPHSTVPSWYFSLVDSCPRRLNAATGTKPKKGYFLFVRDLFFGKNLGFTSEYFQALGFGHILFYNKRVGKHNTRSGQCETCIWRTHYHKGIFSRFSARKFCFTQTWLGEKNWLTRMTKTVIRNCVSEVYRGIPEDIFPNALRSMSSHFSIDSSSRRNCRSAKRVPFYTSFISSTKNFGAIMTSCGFQYIPSHHEM